MNNRFLNNRNIQLTKVTTHKISNQNNLILVENSKNEVFNLTKLWPNWIHRFSLGIIDLIDFIDLIDSKISMPYNFI